MGYPPRKFIEEFAREHPWAALGMLVFHAGCWAFIVYLFLTDE